MGSGWEKFAILGSTYARALGNAAQRAGGRIGAPVLNAIEAQPQARLAPGLSQQARTPGPQGALQPTPHQQQLQATAAKIPESAEGVPGAPGAGHATARFFFNQHFGDRTQMAMRPGARPPMQADVPTGVLPMPKVASPFSTAAGIGIPLAIGGGILASKPGIRADIADRFNAPGDIHQKDVAQEIPQEVQGQATRAHEALLQRGINPGGLRIAVDAPSGAGKTVLSKALASQMGLRHHGLDWRPNLRFHQLMGGGDIEKTPYAPHAGEILEHQQLLRSYDPELFDAVLHIHKDPATIRAQVLKRGRGARTHDLLDYEKSIAVGRKAFETLDGESIDLGGGVMMKVRPQQGWGNQLDQQLATAGIDPMGLSRHQKLLSLHSGKREEHGAGWTPYMKSPFSGGETAALAASVPLGVMAARALARH